VKSVWLWLGAVLGVVVVIGVVALTASRTGAPANLPSEEIDSSKAQDSISTAVAPVRDEVTRPVFTERELANSSTHRVAFGPRHFYDQKELDEMGIRTLLGTFTQEFDEAEYRTINVGRSAELLNGTLLAPGEIFSMNSTIKQRTTENGYVEGIVIGPGGVLAMSYGGGVSITTAATWGAAFFAGLEPIEQQAHTIWIDRYTPGLEATVSWGSLDLRFRNTTASNILISAKANENSVTVSIWGTPVYDEITATFGEREVFSGFSVMEQSGEGCVPQEGQPGFRITVTRDFWRDDAVVKSEDFVTTYQPSTEVTCV
jgi:hypothetical protein